MVGSLRVQLLHRLVYPLLAAVVLEGLSAYYFLVAPAMTAYDQALGNSALALAQQVRERSDHIELRLTTQAERLLRTDRYDKVFYAVLGEEGETLAGDAGLAVPDEAEPDPAGTYFFDSVYRGQPVRVAALERTVGEQEVQVLVAETMAKRRGALFEIALGVVLPQILLCIALLAVLGSGIRRTLAPLERLRNEIQARSPRDLRPVNETLAVDEVRPVVAELNQLLQRLESAQGAQQRFLANAAHQLRTPLAGLHTQLELAMGDPDPHRMRQRLEQCRIATERTSRLVQQLLALSAAESGGRAVSHVQPTDLHRIIDGLAEGWVRQALARDIDLGFELEPAPLDGDPLLLGEMVTNLTDNAIRYTPAGGHVTVRCGRRGRSAYVEVEDDGPGIPVAERERVKERFYRMPGTSQSGSGLGLAIVCEIAERHGVSLELGSAGAGTLARVSFLPAKPESAPVGRMEN